MRVTAVRPVVLGNPPRYNAQRGAVPKWLREQSAKLRCGGLIPPRASTPNLHRGGLVFCLQKSWLFPFLSQVRRGGVEGVRRSGPLSPHYSRGKKKVKKEKENFSRG